MSTVLVDGQEKTDIQIQSNWKLDEAVQYLYEKFNTKTHLITTVKVDGVEMNTGNEIHLRAVPISAIGQIEILTSHPREVAEEMLQNVKEFVYIVREKCLGLVQVEPKADFDKGFIAILDGLSTVAESIKMIRRTLKIDNLEMVSQLEQEYLTIIRALLVAQQKGDDAKIRIILSHKLAFNLEKWHTEGIPAMIRASDC